MNCRIIVREYLITHHYDGLVCDECACGLHDLMPCSEDSAWCEPGYEVEGCPPSCGLGCDSHIVSDRRKKTQRTRELEMKTFQVDRYSIKELPDALWGHEAMLAIPLVYLYCPTGISRQSFKTIINSLILQLPAGFKVEIKE